MGFEPTTSAVTGRRSNQLSHQAILLFSCYYEASLIPAYQKISKDRFLLPI